MSKISDATTVTEDNGLVLGAREKNAAIDGTLANDIEKMENKLKSFLIFRNDWLQGAADNFIVTHAAGDSFKYSYALKSAPEGYRFLFAIPYVEWFSSNEYVDIIFLHGVLLQQSGESYISCKDATISDTTTRMPFVCSATQVFIKI